MKICDVLPVALVLLVSQALAQPVVRLKAAGQGGRSSRKSPRHGDATHFLLQFPTEPGPEMRQELERRGMRVLQYVPDSTLMVASPVAPDLDGLEVLSAGALEPSDKISPLLADQVAGALLVVFHPDAEMAKARETVLTDVQKRLGERLRLPESDLASVARLVASQLDLSISKLLEG